MTKRKYPWLTLPYVRQRASPALRASARMRQRHPRTTVFPSSDSAEESPLGRETQVEFHSSDRRIAINIDLGLINVNSNTADRVERKRMLLLINFFHLRS